jgi:flagellin-like hook-associated protein FlgL
MSRIATLNASNRLLEVMTRVQGRLHDQQVRVTTEKVSQDYAGISGKAGRLVSLETTRAAVGRGIDDNAIMETRLSATDKAVEAMGKTMGDFRAMLLDLGSNKPLDEAHVTEVQAFAFRALKDMEGYLNTEVNGRFLFSGSRATTRPADLGLTTMAGFQDRFDGQGVIYPPTRSAHVGATATLPPAVTGGLTVSGGDTITAANPGAFANLAVGATIRLSGSANGNDGEYTVVSTNGSDRITIAGTLTMGSVPMTVTNGINNGAEAGATLAVANWYAGDEVTGAHRVEGDRTLSLGLNAVDPAFEKAIRAMGMIAQGQYGTAGGLEQNLERVDHALSLLDGALERASGAPELLGPERAGNVETARMNLGFDLAVIHETRERQKALAVSLDNQTAEIENVDPLEAMTKLLDDGRALEASYQVVARIRQFSLMNYL